MPTLFVGSLIWSNNPNLVSIALNMISTYATDFLKGIPGKPKVKLEIIVPNSQERGSKRITYEGDVEGLKQVAEIAKDVFTKSDDG